MADILIRGMEMPGTCFMCPLSFMNGERLFCRITKEEVLRGKIAPECPIDELPEHGDLIDRDALRGEFDKAQKSVEAHGRGFSDAFMSGGEVCAEWWAVERKLEDAPVIIPADKEVSE